MEISLNWLFLLVVSEIVVKGHENAAALCSVVYTAGYWEKSVTERAII